MEGTNEIELMHDIFDASVANIKSTENNCAAKAAMFEELLLELKRIVFFSYNAESRSKEIRALIERAEKVREGK